MKRKAHVVREYEARKSAHLECNADECQWYKVPVQKKSIFSKRQWALPDESDLGRQGQNVIIKKHDKARCCKGGGWGLFVKLLKCIMRSKLTT